MVADSIMSEIIRAEKEDVEIVLYLKHYSFKGGIDKYDKDTITIFYQNDSKKVLSTVTVLLDAIIGVKVDIKSKNL